MATITIFKLGSLPAVSKTFFSQKWNLPLRVEDKLGPKFLAASKLCPTPLKGESPPQATTSQAFLLHGHCSGVPLLEKHFLHPTLLHCPHNSKAVKAWRISERFPTPPLNLASLCLSSTAPVMLPSSTMVPSPLSLLLSHRMGNSSGASKDKGRSDTITALLEPKSAKQEVPWFKINNDFPSVHFPTYYTKRLGRQWI